MRSRIVPLLAVVTVAVLAGCSSDGAPSAGPSTSRPPSDATTAPPRNDPTTTTTATTTTAAPAVAAWAELEPWRRRPWSSIATR